MFKITIPPSLVKWTMSKISANMKSPSNNLMGQLAMQIMKTFNPPSIHEAVRRLELRDSDTFLEIGAGHGESLRAMVNLHQEYMQKNTNAEKTMYNVNYIPKRVILVEISPAFQTTLHNLIASEIIPKNLFPTPMEIHGTDCKSMSYLEDNSVDTIFGFNLVYFLDPLEEYLMEMKRVLQPGGKVVFGCKFGSLPKKGESEDFVNVDRNDICRAMENVGFVNVVAEKVVVGDNPMKNYVEIKGFKESNYT